MRCYQSSRGKPTLIRERIFAARPRLDVFFSACDREWRWHDDLPKTYWHWRIHTCGQIGVLSSLYDRRNAHFHPFTPNLRTFLLCPFFSFIRQRNYPAKRSVAAKRMKEAAARCKLVLFGRFIAYSFADFQRSWTCYSRESVENPLNKSNVVRTHRWLKQFFKMSYDTWRWKKCREATCIRWLTKRRRVSSEIEASRSVVDSARPSGCCRNLWLLWFIRSDPETDPRRNEIIFKSVGIDIGYCVVVGKMLDVATRPELVNCGRLTRVKES